MLRSLSRVAVPRAVARLSAPSAARSIVTLSNTDSSGVAIMQLKNEPLNKLSLDFMKQMTENVKEAEARANCRALILTSTCRIFSAGLDLEQLVKPNKEALREYWTAYQDLCFTIYGTRLATIASLDGHTLGAGCALALCCDSRILLKSARIGLNEAEYGLGAPSWTVDLFKAAIGNHHAERACSLGSVFEADHAALLGLVDIVARHENFSVESYKEAMKWASIPGRDLNKQSFRANNLKLWNSPEAREQDFDTFHDMISNGRKQAILSSYIEHIQGSSVSDNKDTFEDGEDLDDDEEDFEERKHSSSPRKNKSAENYSSRRKHGSAGHSNNKRPNRR